MENLKRNAEEQEITVERKLIELYTLQQVDSKIDKIRIIRGELPLEVQDLEDEIAGMETRIAKFNEELEKYSNDIVEYKNKIKEATSLIKKYEEQQNNVRNNREYESLTKEIEYQSLEIELCEKHINDFNKEIKAKTEELTNAESRLEERKIDLKQKKAELSEIVAETKQEEENLIMKSKELESLIEERLLTAFKRIRKNARNGLAVVTVERDACGGCFNKIPPQRQLDIRMRKKIIVCEYCGRILVDTNINEESAL